VIKDRHASLCQLRKGIITRERGPRQGNPGRRRITKGSCYLDSTSSTQDIWNIGNGKYRWVFVGPEKVQQVLKDESLRSHVNLVAIDEDYLIDEWSVYLETILQ
jgi:hypothetical protein